MTSVFPAICVVHSLREKAIGHIVDLSFGSQLIGENGEFGSKMLDPAAEVIRESNNRVLLPSQSERLVALNGQRVHTERVWDTSLLLTIGSTVLRLEYGSDRHDVERRRDVWDTIHDGATGLVNREFFEETVRKRDRVGALTVLLAGLASDGALPPLILQGLARKLSHDQSSRHILSYLAPNQYIMFTERIHSTNIATRLRPLIDNGINVVDWDTDRVVRLVAVVVNITQPHVVPTFVRTCLEKLHNLSEVPTEPIVLA